MNPSGRSVSRAGACSDGLAEPSQPPGCAEVQEAGFMKTMLEKGRAFQALHARQGLFVMPNPWDPGSARLLAGLGFEALATTSAGFARAIGKADYHVTREDV